jgi:hypothetical protein
MSKSCNVKHAGNNSGLKCSHYFLLSLLRFTTKSVCVIFLLADCITQMLAGMYVFFFPWGGMRLSPLSMLATNWPTVSAHGDWWRWVWSRWWNEKWQRKAKYLEKTCPSATLSTRNPAWPDLGLNLGHHAGNLAINHLSYGIAECCYWSNTVWMASL